MKDLLEAIATYIPRFLNNFIEIVAGPKKFLMQIDFNRSDTMKNAASFYIISATLAIFLEIPFIKEDKSLYIRYMTAIIISFSLTILASFIFFYHLK
jgi:hypothetical protein